MADFGEEARTAGRSAARRLQASPAGRAQSTATATTTNEVKAQDRHLKAQVAAGDETHREAHQAMRGRLKRPISGHGYLDVKREFAPLTDKA